MSRNKPQMLLIARNFPPLVGGIEQLMKSMYDEMQDDYDITLLGPVGCKHYIKPCGRAVQLPTSAILFVPLSIFLSPILGLMYRPEVVIYSNGLMSMSGWLTAKLCRARLLGFLHGLDLTAPSRVYQMLFLPFIRRTRLCIVNSENTRQLAIDKNIPAAQLKIIHPCIRLPDLKESRGELKSRLEGLEPYILYAGRVVPRKGLLEFLNNCADWIQANNLQVVVAGDKPSGSAWAGDASYLQRLTRIVEAKNLVPHVHFLGRLSDQEMATCFRHAGVHIMPLVHIDNDVEGFGMVAVEAASYGTPTVAFNCGGVSDAIMPSCFLISPGDYASFRDETLAVLRGKSDTASLRRWADNFSPHQFGLRLRKVL